MIELKNETAFAHGSHRAVYRHPSNPQRCLKAMTEDFKENSRWKNSSFISKLVRPRRYFQDNDAELHFNDEVKKRIGSKISAFIAEAHGYVDTDLGPVLEVDLITDHDGKISMSLKEYLFNKGMTPECQKALDLFWNTLDETWTFVRGRPDNLSVSQDAVGNCHIYAIDGYAFGQFIPLAKWFRKQQKRLHHKRIQEQKRLIAEILEIKEQGGTLTGNGLIAR